MMTFNATLILGGISIVQYITIGNIFSGTVYLILAIIVFNALQVMLFSNENNND